MLGGGVGGEKGEVVGTGDVRLRGLGCHLGAIDCLFVQGGAGRLSPKEVWAGRFVFRSKWGLF